MDKNNQPVELVESTLDEANAGIGLLLPAVQKIREAAVQAGDEKSITDGTSNARFADGSVRFLKGGTN